MTYPVGNHFVYGPPGSPEPHNLLGLGIVGQILHGGVVMCAARSRVLRVLGCRRLRKNQKVVADDCPVTITMGSKRLSLENCLPFFAALQQAGPRTGHIGLTWLATGHVMRRETSRRTITATAATAAKLVAPLEKTCPRVLLHGWLWPFDAKSLAGSPTDKPDMECWFAAVFWSELVPRPIVVWSLTMGSSKRGLRHFAISPGSRFPVPGSLCRDARKVNRTRHVW
jgi:hypothetical protein